MRVLKNDEEDRTVKLFAETEGKKINVCHWINCNMICDKCLVFEHKEESLKRFPDGVTYDEAVEFLEGK